MTTDGCDRPGEISEKNIMYNNNSSTPSSSSSSEAGDIKSSLFSPGEPLRQPRTSPPVSDGGAESRSPIPPGHNSSSGADALVKNSTLSAAAPEFVPGCYPSFQDDVYSDESEGYYAEPSLADFVQDFVIHLNSSPGSFESEIDYITDMLNSWVTTEEILQELVELIYVQSTSIPNFAYTGARLCNHLSHYIRLSPASGNFRQLLLKRCRTEYEQREQAVRGDPDTQKRFHSYVLFLGELYLNLELSGSILEDTWKEKGHSDMDEIIKKIEEILLDAKCSRDVRQMLLKLVELRSSNWGRVHTAAVASDATPDNDPNYFMNEPTFYTADGTPFTAADPEYSDKYQEILDREDYFPDAYEENGNDSFMFMYVDESVDVFYADGSRLQLSPCGSEFMIEKHMSPSAHPLQPKERVRQRTRFAISEYKTLVLNALEFRNKYATHPYLPEELITVEFNKTFTSAITEVEWPGSDFCTAGPHGEITVCSVDGHAKLVLSSSGEEFTVEFICRSSQNEVESHIVDGVIPMVEISPGDGSVIRSNGVLANYFTHYKAGAAHRDVVECVYYLCGLPPDVSGQLYSIQSVVTRASSVEKWSRDSRQKLTGGASSICQMGTKLLSKLRQTKLIKGMCRQ
ncbi:polyadenylate-binding -interacting 1-like protein [Labeo rohita]|uniref:Polyadenylate-binding protein-interacting protein 1 n=1 Tax=Labeo rohita TaxID=84645 RepID=A0A498N0A7_LABRO|nr:polyadenylate-binding -interacting 1-like protein [Labeo rohita]